MERRAGLERISVPWTWAGGDERGGGCAVLFSGSCKLCPYVVTLKAGMRCCRAWRMALREWRVWVETSFLSIPDNCYQGLEGEGGDGSDDEARERLEVLI